MSIIDLSAQKSPKNFTTEICIIGSGCGGATAAWRLAEAGHEVTVLEEGGDFTGRQLTQRGGEMYDQLYMDRGGRSTEDMSISILQGRALGGGGVINASDVVRTPKTVYDFWAKHYGLDDYTASHMEPHVQRALQDLHAKTIRDDQVNVANRLLKEGGEKMGYKGEVMMHNREQCAGLGTCMIGCPVNAKKNPRFVAIPGAMEKGATFYTRARAVKVHDAEKDLKRIQVKQLDSKGYHEVGSFEIKASIVILAANAIGSAQLLLRSGIGNQHVGQHLSLQPQLPIMAQFKEKINAFRGIPQSYAITEFEEEDNKEHGLWGFRVEPVMGTPDLVASLNPFTGQNGKEQMVRYPHLASSLLLVPDDPVGTIQLSKAQGPIVQYAHAENHKTRLQKAVKAASRAYLAAGAETVIVPLTRPITIKSESDLEQVDGLTFDPVTAPLISAHQQGGVRMSSNQATGAADPDCQVYGTKNTYVFDSSGFPSSSSSHTMTPIISHAHYLSSRLIETL